jgi:hypothetical protein
MKAQGKAAPLPHMSNKIKKFNIIGHAPIAAGGKLMGRKLPSEICPFI